MKIQRINAPNAIYVKLNLACMVILCRLTLRMTSRWCDIHLPAVF